MSLLHYIALSLVSGVGDVTAKSLISVFGNAENVFKAHKKDLLKVAGVGEKTAENILHHNKDIFQTAENEVSFAEKYHIQTLIYGSDNYPKRLLNCSDAPLILYYKGNANLNQPHILSIVGTRKATDYGKEMCKRLLEELQAWNVLVISGLAYGIDITAHKESLRLNVPTVGVLAHGLDRIYPSKHRQIAESMVQNGGLLTEFRQNTIPDKENFPQRNRIVAGIADATIVVEANYTGGALITAEIASSYNRDVFALPGRCLDEYSQGCNNLIKNNKAALITSGSDIAYIMGWESQKIIMNKPQLSLLLNLTDDERKIIAILQDTPNLGIDNLLIVSEMSQSKLVGVLLNLEMQGIIKSLPGNAYRLC